MLIEYNFKRGEGFYFDIACFPRQVNNARFILSKMGFFFFFYKLGDFYAAGLVFLGLFSRCHLSPL